MFYENTKAMVRSLDGDANFFDIVVGIFQEYTYNTIFVYYLPRHR